MTSGMEWQGDVGESWAREWERTDRGFINLTDWLIDTMAAEPYGRVLDIGCGAGEVSIRLADRNPKAIVRGVDVSPALVSAAQKRAGERRSSVRFELADAAQWNAADGEQPDLLVSRHGVMFFDDPSLAFANLRMQAASGARLVFSCFRAPRFSPFFTEVGQILPPAETPPDPLAPGPFAFADDERVRGILEHAGWQDVTFEPRDVAMVVGMGADPVADAVEYFTRIGPAAAILRESDDVRSQQILNAIREIAERNCSDGVVSMQAGMWIVRAKAP